MTTQMGTRLTLRSFKHKKKNAKSLLYVAKPVKKKNTVYVCVYFVACYIKIHKNLYYLAIFLSEHSTLINVPFEKYQRPGAFIWEYTDSNISKFNENCTVIVFHCRMEKTGLQVWWYGMSYLWYSAVGVAAVLVTGMITSIITGK